MKNWLASLTLKQKLFLLQTLALIPWFAALTYLAYCTWPEIHRLEREIEEARHLLALTQIQDLLQRHRGLSYTYFLSPEGPRREKLKNALKDIEKHFHEEMARTRKILGAYHPEVLHYLDEIAQRFTRLELDNFQGSPEENFQAHSQLVLRILYFMEKEGRKHGLFSDPDLHVRTLAEVALVELPKFTEILGRICGLGSGYLARQTLNSAEKKTLFKLYTSAYGYAEVLEWSLKTIPVSKETVFLLENAYRQFENLLSQSENLLAQGFQNRNFTPEEYFKQASDVIRTFQLVGRRMTGELIARLEEKKHRLWRNWGISVAAISLVFIFFALSFYLAYRDVVRKLRAISEGAKRIASGDLSARIELDSPDEIGEVAQVLNQSVEKLRANLEEIYFLHYYDHLTRLPNRDKLLDDLWHMETPALLLLDISNFKDLNFIYGEDCGDEILRSLAQRLRRLFPYQVYRVGPDEFAVLLDMAAHNLSRKDFFELARQGIDRLEEQPFFCGEDEIYLSFFGAAVCDCVYPEKLLIFAYDALKEGKDTWEKLVKVASPAEKRKSHYQENMYWIRKTKLAIREGRLVPFYQPILNNRTGRIEKFEALVRMIDRDGRVISPAKFLEVSKKVGIYPEITYIMIERALKDFHDLPFEVSLNLSFQDFETPGVMDFLLTKLELASQKDFLVEPHRIVFEVLETEKIVNYELIAHFLKEAKKRGCKIAIDDFGTGYSNLERIIELKVDYLKIDASLIRRLPTEENVRLLVEAILNFARRVGIKTIAEYVADEGLFNLVREMGIDYSQGYYIGSPEPIEVIRRKYL